MGLLLLLCILAVIYQVKCEIKDKSTGIAFKESVNGLPCLGAGVRAKGPIKVYSVAVYAPKGAVKSKLAKLKGKDVGSLKASKLLEEAVVDGAQSKAIVIKLARTVGSEFFTSALSKSVGPRMGGKDADKLQAWKNLFLGMSSKFTPKDELKYLINGGSITSFVNSKNIGSIRSPALCKAFLSCYADANSVSPAAKDSFARTAHAWVNENY